MPENNFPRITSPEIRAYCETMSSDHAPILEEIYQRSLSTYSPKMVSGPFLGRMLSMISKLVAPKCILEIGTYTGYGAVCLLEGLTPNGQLITIEKDEKMFGFSSDIFKREKLDTQITEILGDAKEVIETLDHTFDLVFIDAAKRQYIDYYELVLAKMNKGGVILADNVLWKGKIVTDENDKLGKGLDDFNQYVKKDNRVENLIIPIDDGLHFIRKL